MTLGRLHYNIQTSDQKLLRYIKFQILTVTPKDDSVWLSIATTARHLDWTVNRVSSSEEAVEFFHKGDEVPAVVFVDCRHQNDKTVDAHQIARYVNVSDIGLFYLS